MFISLECTLSRWWAQY